MELVETTKVAMEGVASGQVAVKSGYSAMQLLDEKILSMKNNFDLVGRKISEEFKLVTTIKNEFNIIDKDIIEIAAVLEENAAHFEEISARTEIQINTTVEVSSAMSDVAEIGENLSNFLLSVN